jgi:hypothetical protein
MMMWWANVVAKITVGVICVIKGMVEETKVISEGLEPLWH